MRKLKLFFACLLMAVLSIGQVWGAEATIANTDNNGTCVWTDGTATITQVKWAGSTNVNNTYATNLRVYGGHVLLFDAGEGNTWKSFEYTVDTKYYGKSVSWGSSAAEITSSNYTSATAGTGSLVSTGGGSSTLGFTANRYAYIYNSATSSPVQLRITAFTATYEKSGGSTPPTPSKTLESVTVSGDPTKTSYTAGENFDPAGLTVTGHYSDNTDEEITSGITWSYDPSQELSLNQTSIGVIATVSEIASPKFDVTGLTVTEAPAAVNYEKVTAEPADWSGEYLLVYEADATNARVWKGADQANYYAEAAISNGVIAAPDDAAVLTIAKVAESDPVVYTIMVGDKYIGQTSNANGIKIQTTAINNSISYNGTDAAVDIVASSAHLRYNSASSSYFRYYKSATYSAQKKIQLYKKVEDTVKPAAGLAYAEADKKNLIKFGETFTAPTLVNPNNLTVAYASNNTAVAEVASNGAVTIKAAGVAVITASFDGDDNYKAGSASYTIGVVNHLGTEVDPFDVADARRVIDAFGTKEGVYMSGIVSQITTSYDETYHNISFDISTDGTPTADQVRAYRCKGLDNTDFTSEDDVKTGATVTVYGNLKKYNSTYEFDAGCYLKAYEAPAVPKTHIANTKETAYTVAQALVYAADGATYDLDDYVYISGVVYDVQNFNNGKLSIFIKDADAENQFELYNCAGINDGSATTPFESIDDVKVGNVVIGYGQMMYYQQGDIYEFKAGNYLVELQKPVTGVWISELSAEVEAGATYTLTANVLPANATGTIDWTVESGDAYASVDENGVVTGIDEGVAVIRATAHGTEFYKECTVTVTASSTPVLTDYYEKATSVVEGTYLIVYEDVSVAFNGSLETLDAKNNVIDVEITNDNKIGVTSATEAATVYIDPTAGTIKAANGKYIGITSYGNGLSSGDNGYVHTNMSIEEGNAVLFIQKEEWNDNKNGKMQLCYNSASDQNRFRYFKEGSQKAIQLYKLANETIKDNPNLEWDKESIELTVGGLFISPELSHAQGITGTISYVSDNENVATVENGVISLVAEATGTAHITASYAGDENYKPGSAVCTIKVNPAHSIYVDKLSVNFGSVAKDASVDDQVITVTLTEVPNATATLSGSGASAYSIDPAALTASGTITISASTATVGTFNAKLTISDNAGEAEAKEVNLKLIVTDPASEETPISTSTKWVVATDADLVDGKEVIITSVKGEVVYAMGEQKSTNRTAYAATVDGEGVLTPGEGTMSFTLVAQEAEGVFALRTSDGKYLYAAASGSNHLKTQDNVDVNAQWTLTATSAVAESSTNRNIMRFNGSGTNNLFSCYSSGQTAIQFYVPKPVTPPTPQYELVRENLAANRYYTLCFNRTMEAVQGATFWTFASKDANMAYLVQEDAPYAAGKPYIIYAEAAGDLTAVLSGDVETNPGVNGALHGTFSLMEQTHLNAAGENIYLLMNNELRRVDGQSGNSLPANRAYIALDQIANTGAPANVPAHRVRAIPMHKDVVTGFENINATDKPVKLLIDGNIYILRGEKMYDATGRLVK